MDGFNIGLFLFHCYLDFMEPKGNPQAFLHFVAVANLRAGLKQHLAERLGRERPQPNGQLCRLLDEANDLTFSRTQKNGIVFKGMIHGSFS
jgi:hypothetical protein